MIKTEFPNNYISMNSLNGIHGNYNHYKYNYPKE